VKSYFDTSILLPALVQSHPQHIAAAELFREARSRGKVVCLSLHVYAELYANLTRFPLGDKIHPEVAMKTILALRESVDTVDLTAADYEAALRRCAERELISGIIYDALHYQAAIKAKVDVLYTGNRKDFERLHSADSGFELKSPGEIR